MWQVNRQPDDRAKSSKIMASTQVAHRWNFLYFGLALQWTRMRLSGKILGSICNINAEMPCLV
jgi:hypothetical protein